MNSMFLGMFPASDPMMDLEDRILQVKSGDRLLIYSDGLVEAPNKNGDGYGVERLKELLESHRGRDIDQVNKIIWEKVQAYVYGSIPDDVTYILMEF
jgi:serine phosphatase RsbU (regulator of sigma subunit)